MKQYLLPFLFVALMVSPGRSQTINLVRTITPHGKTTFSSRLRDLFFGKSEIRQTPFSIAILKNGNIVVSDVENSQLLLMDNQGLILRIVKKIGRIPFGSPVGICIDQNGNVYVADSARMGIVKFDDSLKKGKLFVAVPNSRLCGMVWMKNRLYCADAANHLIRCFDISGNPVFSFGRRGIGAGEFNFPVDVAATDDRLYVLDALNFRIQMFDSTGKFLGTFGKNGTGGGSFSKPKSIAVNHPGQILVSDVSFDNIQVFDSKGNFLYVLGKRGSGRGEFWMPSGVAFQSDTRFLVADTYNHRIQEFEIRGINK